MKASGMTTLSAFYIVYFIYLGFATFSSKYFAQIGLNESQIGMLTSLPALVAMCFMPLWGALTDRVRLKKMLVAGMIVLSALAFFFVDALTDFSLIDPQTGALASDATRFLPLLFLLTLSAFFGQPVMPAATSIALEHTSAAGKSFGPIRMLGTVGYQIGALAIGFICVISLRHLFTYQAIALLVAAAVGLMMPNVRGHQFGKKKVSPFRVLADKRVRILLALVLIATCTTMFYQSFFGAYLEMMGVDNRMASIIMWVSVALEIPVLFFAVRIMRKLSIWQWMVVGFALNGLRWLGFALAHRMGSWQVLLISQIPAVTAMACFEFFPALYIGGIIAPELSSSAQTLLNVTSFGIAKFIGSMIGGFISHAIGIRTMFILCGCLLLVGAVAIYPICRRLTLAERAG
ncbi:MAG: MFS transporter [Christensenellales bacterium]|jgi:PPP family 3-phenylpropionic acid transporter